LCESALNGSLSKQAVCSWTLVCVGGGLGSLGPWGEGELVVGKGGLYHSLAPLP